MMFTTYSMHAYFFFTFQGIFENKIVENLEQI